MLSTLVATFATFFHWFCSKTKLWWWATISQLVAQMSCLTSNDHELCNV